MLTSVLPPAINATRSKVLRPILWALCLIAQSLLAAQPVAWWTFDDPASLGRDSAGTNDAALVGAPPCLFWSSQQRDSDERER
jgi:hypothetical protein